MMLHVSERKRLYAFFARIFSYPDQELTAKLRQSEAAEAGRLLPAAPAPPALDASTVELETAYTDLFINRLGGAPAPPYGSVYLERDERLMGQTTLHVAEAYRSEGLSLEGSGEPPDFLPTELEFLYYLVEQ
jgi:putative dimethyl sulfoxide reductase chaperone